MVPCIYIVPHIQCHAYMAPHIWHHAYTVPCVYSVMHIRHHAYMVPCVYGTMCIWHCIYGTMRIWCHAYTAPCIYGTMHIQHCAYMALGERMSHLVKVSLPDIFLFSDLIFPDSYKIPWLFGKIFKFPDFSLTGKTSLIFSRFSSLSGNPVYGKKQPVLPRYFSLRETELHQPVYKTIFRYFMQSYEVRWSRKLRYFQNTAIHRSNLM